MNMLVNKHNQSSHCINDFSSPFKAIIQRYSDSLGSHLKIDRLSQNIKSYVLKNFAKKNALIGDDVNDYLPDELTHLKQSHDINSNILNDNDKPITNYYKLHQTRIKNIKAKNMKRDNAVRNIKESNASCSFTHYNYLSLSHHSKANNSLVIQSSSLLPILSSSRIDCNNNDGGGDDDAKRKLIQLKIKENIERNIKKKRRLYDRQHDKLIAYSINHPESLRLLRIIKMKHPLNEIQNDIMKIEDAVSIHLKQSQANIHQSKGSQLFLNKRLAHLLSKNEEN